MSKLPYIQFYPLDWLRDTAKLSPQAQGQWMKILCYAWNEPQRGVYEREETAACHELGEDYATLKDLLDELQYVANISVDVIDDKTIVRIESRRMIKEEKARKLNADYQSRFRQNKESKENISTNNMKVSAKKLDVRSQKLEVKEKQEYIYKPAPRFQTPTAQEAKDYAASIGFRLDGEAFVAHYESNGWLVGKVPMKNWRAAVVTWKKSAHPSAMITGVVSRRPTPDKPMTEEESRQGLAFTAQLREALRGGAKEIPK